MERLEQRAPASKGGHLRREFEYERHGTTTLMAALNVRDGKIVNRYINPTRTEADFLIFVKQTVEPLIKDKADVEVIILADQLNTHVSESLVLWIADILGIKGILGKKRKKGILYDQQTRKAFLEDEKHRIRFVFTPKHCSWINPIENWFAKLQRHVLYNGSFPSVKELETKIEKYIDYHNTCKTKPLKWKFNGFEKGKILYNLNIQ